MRPLPSRLTLTAALVAATALVACGEEDARNEANVFLDRVRAIDIQDPLEERRARVQALEEISPHDAEVRHARDVCVKMHSALVEAETEQGHARGMFKMFRGAGRPSDAQRAEIERALHASEAATTRAQRSLPACTHAVTDLELRYGRRRSSP